MSKEATPPSLSVVPLVCESVQTLGLALFKDSTPLLTYPTYSVTRCWIKKVAQMFPKVALIISTSVFILIDLFQNSPKVNNVFGLLW